MRGDLERRGYTLDEVTRAMGMMLDHISVPRPDLGLRPADVVGAPAHSRRAIQTCSVVWIRPRSTSWPHLLQRERQHRASRSIFDTDCGIYNVGTIESARRRGLATALTAIHLHDARDRGCQTASLQSTEIAERVYAALGFRDLGRILEYIPAQA